MKISNIVGISLIILKNLDDFEIRHQQIDQRREQPAKRAQAERGWPGVRDVGRVVVVGFQNRPDFRNVGCSEVEWSLVEFGEV